MPLSFYVENPSLKALQQQSSGTEHRAANNSYFEEYLGHMQCMQPVYSNDLDWPDTCVALYMRVIIHLSAIRK